MGHMVGIADPTLAGCQNKGTSNNRISTTRIGITGSLGLIVALEKQLIEVPISRCV